MAYPNERAAKNNHRLIINNKRVQEFLQQCEVRDSAPSESELNAISHHLDTITDTFPTNLNHVICLDGGYKEVSLNTLYPIRTLCYYNVGILSFMVNDLGKIKDQQTINPEEISELEDMEQFSFVVPMRNICIRDKDFCDTLRTTIFQLFTQPQQEDRHAPLALIQTLKWLVFREYNKADGEIKITCPKCKKINSFAKQSSNYLDSKNDTIHCTTDSCNEILYLTDCFELHNMIDDVRGASPIQSYILNIVEVMLLLDKIRTLLSVSLSQLSQTLFIKDGSLALFNRLDDFAHKVIRPFMQFLYTKSIQDKRSYNNIIGINKSGIFVEHFRHIKTTPHYLIMPNLEYIQAYITGKHISVFGANTYFGIKLFAQIDSELSFVFDVALPFDEGVRYQEYIKNPHCDDCLSLKSIIEVLKKLKCDLYTNAFVPIAMINRLVSLSEIPGKKILRNFSEDYLEQ